MQRRPTRANARPAPPNICTVIFASFLFCASRATRYASAMLWAYTKYHALGNDYIVIDPKNLPAPLTTGAG